MGETKRLLSLDVLRGFDMFFITVGGGAIITSFCRLFPDCGWARSMILQFEHVEWAGFHFEDLIFPLFLFIAGVAAGLSSHASHQKIIHRALLLFLLGFLNRSGFLEGQYTQLRLGSVLGRIGVAGGLAALIWMHTGRLRSRLFWLAGILLGYWAIMYFGGKLAFGGDPFGHDTSLACWFDQHFVPGRLMDTTFDNLGVLPTLSSVATALLGMFAGWIVKNSDTRFTPYRKAGLLAASGVALLAVAWLWNPFFPIIKRLWTGSFICMAGGWSMLLFALLYWLTDILPLGKGFFFFKIIGMNALAAYLAPKVFSFSYTANFFFGAAIHSLPIGTAGQMFLSRLAFSLTVWVFLYVLYKKNWFIKV